jgi:membrane fusion protein, multidrug efflux system
MKAARTLMSGSALLLLGLAVTSCNRGDAVADTADVTNAVLVGPENIVVVKAQEIRTGPTLSGTIEAERTATIRAEVPAVVIQVYAEPGQRVPAGAVLGRLDDTGIRDAALSARAAVATAQNAYDIAKRELERAEALE